MTKTPTPAPTPPSTRAADPPEPPRPAARQRRHGGHGPAGRHGRRGLRRRRRDCRPVAPAATLLGFTAVPKSLADTVVVPAGYTASVLYALGDPLDRRHAPRTGTTAPTPISRIAPATTTTAWSGSAWTPAGKRAMRRHRARPARDQPRSHDRSRRCAPSSCTPMAAPHDAAPGGRGRQGNRRARRLRGRSEQDQRQVGHGAGLSLQLPPHSAERRARSPGRRAATRCW